MLPLPHYGIIFLEKPISYLKGQSTKSNYLKTLQSQHSCSKHSDNHFYFKVLQAGSFRCIPNRPGSMGKAAPGMDLTVKIINLYPISNFKISSHPSDGPSVISEEQQMVNITMFVNFMNSTFFWNE